MNKDDWSVKSARPIGWSNQPDTAREIRDEIERLLRQGLPHVEVARRTKVSSKTVQRLVSRGRNCRWCGLPVQQSRVRDAWLHKDSGDEYCYLTAEPR